MRFSLVVSALSPAMARRVYSWAGGGGASYATICAVIAELGRHCGSTALAYSMHTHPVLLNVFKYKRGDAQAEATLKKIAAGELVTSRSVNQPPPSRGCARLPRTCRSRGTRR